MKRLLKIPRRKKPTKARIKIELIVDLNDQIRFDFEGTQAEISALLVTAASCRSAFRQAMGNAYSAFKLLVDQKREEMEREARCKLMFNNLKN